MPNSLPPTRALRMVASVREIVYSQRPAQRHNDRRWRPYRGECTGSLPISEVKRRRARLVLGWATAREDLRALPAFPNQSGRCHQTKQRKRLHAAAGHTVCVGARHYAQPLCVQPFGSKPSRRPQNRNGRSLAYARCRPSLRSGRRPAYYISKSVTAKRPRSATKEP